jgi:predicted O-linked N-acetylglucosamine transferase (SPINDLY family)
MPSIAEALKIAVEHQRVGRFAAAEEIYRRILVVEPDQVNALHLLGVAAYQRGDLESAIDHIRRAISLQGTVGAFHNNLGLAFQERGQADEAVACYRRALELNPDSAGAYVNLGNVFKEQDKPNEAVAAYGQALQLQPDAAEAHNNLGVVFRSLRRMDEALAAYRRALALRPDAAEIHNNLGIAFQDQGEPEAALAAYRRALELRPDYAETHSNLLYLLYLCPDCDARTIQAEHRRWNQQHALPLARHIQPHANNRSPGRRLRIGYVSPDFFGHPVGLFMWPLLEAHDREGFEIFCYASVGVPDAITERCRASADVWRNVLGTSDEQLAQAIRQDRIDVLVDLSMHTARNRLLVFARKPAPARPG